MTSSILASSRTVSANLVLSNHFKTVSYINLTTTRSKCASVVLGWALSTPRQVSRMADIHRRVFGDTKDGKVVEYCLEPPHMFNFDQPEQEKATDALLERMREQVGVREG